MFVTPFAAMASVTAAATPALDMEGGPLRNGPVQGCAGCAEGGDGVGARACAWGCCWEDLPKGPRLLDRTRMPSARSCGAMPWGALRRRQHGVRMQYQNQGVLCNPRPEQVPLKEAVGMTQHEGVQARNAIAQEPL